MKLKKGRNKGEKVMKKIDVFQWIATVFVLMMQLALNTGMAAWICGC